MDSRFLYIPVLLGTSRKGRMSAHVGRLIAAVVLGATVIATTRSTEKKQASSPARCRRTT